MKSFWGVHVHFLAEMFAQSELFLSPSVLSWSHRAAEAALEYLDFLDENEQLDGAGLISDDNGTEILLPSDCRLEISGTGGESEAKLNDEKSLTTREMITVFKCAFLEVHLKVEMFAEFGGMDCVEDAGD